MHWYDRMLANVASLKGGGAVVIWQDWRRARLQPGPPARDSLGRERPRVSPAFLS